MRQTMSDRDAVRRWRSSGLDCAIITSGIGFFNGYVRLPDDHMARRLGYSVLNRAIKVHYGLTYGTDSDGWVGFDTGHSGDYWPGVTNEALFIGPAYTTWDMERLAAEVESLADQLAGITALPDPEDAWDCTEDEFKILLRQARAWRRLRSLVSA